MAATVLEALENARHNLKTIQNTSVRLGGLAHILRIALSQLTWAIRELKAGEDEAQEKDNKI